MKMSWTYCVADTTLRQQSWPYNLSAVQCVQMSKMGARHVPGQQETQPLNSSPTHAIPTSLLQGQRSRCSFGMPY